MGDPRQSSDTALPPPLLPRIETDVRLRGVRGRLSVEVGPFGQPDIQFVVGRWVKGDVWWPDSETRSLTVRLADGRRLSLRRCVVSGVRQALNTVEGWTRSTTRLSPLSLSVTRPGGRAHATEFGFANLQLVRAESLRFGGRDFAFRWADHGGYRRPEAPHHDPAPLTHWAATPTESPAEVRSALSAATNLALTASMFTHERVAVPCYRVVDAGGEEVEFHVDRVTWPELADYHLLYSGDWQAALQTVGSSDTGSLFRKYEVQRFVNYVLEARQCRYEELKIACLLMALECLTGRWALANGCTLADLKDMALPQKLKRTNKRLGFIESKYTDGTLSSHVRNPLFHMGEVPAMSLSELTQTTRGLSVLATDVFFRLFGYVRPEP